MLIAAMGVGAALAFVLGLGALALWALRRFGGRTLLGRRARLPMEVVQRVSLGPKTHLAVVRVGEKVMAVSMGDGGVRPLFELAPEDRERVLAASTVPVPLESSAAAQAGITRATAGSAAASHAVQDAAVAEPFGVTLDRAYAPPRTAIPVAPRQAPPAEPVGEAVERVMERMQERMHARSEQPLREAPLREAPDRRLAALRASPRAPERAAATRPAPPARPRRPVFTRDEPREVPGFLTAPRPGLAPRLALLFLALALPAVRPVRAQGAAQAAAPAATAIGAGAQPAVAPPRAPAVTIPTPPAPPARPVDPRAAARRAGNGAQVTPQGAASSRALSLMQLDSAPRTPATVSADEAILRLMPQVDMTVGGGAPGTGLRLNGTVGVVVMMGLLTLLPTLLLMMTGFTRILIVLNFLKQALGTQTAPPGALVASLALLLTGFVMGPTLAEVNRTALTPWMDGQITQVEMMQTGAKPMRAFMLRQTKEADMATFLELSRLPKPASVDDVPIHVLMAAFVSSELRTAFQIGFAIYLPFIIIDTVVASVLMSMGMFMLPPAMISLPFKLLLFVLVDGWNLTITSLIQSFK